MQFKCKAECNQKLILFQKILKVARQTSEFGSKLRLRPRSRMQSLQVHVAFDLRTFPFILFEIRFGELCRRAGSIGTCKALLSLRKSKTKWGKHWEPRKDVFMFRESKSKHHHRKFPISTRNCVLCSLNCFMNEIVNWSETTWWFMESAEGCKRSNRSDSHHDRWWDFHGKSFKARILSWPFYRK